MSIKRTWRGRILCYAGYAALCAILFSALHTSLAAGEYGVNSAWLFDDGEGTAVKDSSGNGHNGTIEGAQWVEGRHGNALEFKGESRVVFPAETMGNLTEFTFAAWIYPYSYGGSDIGVIFQKTSRWMFRLRGSGLQYMHGYDKTGADSFSKGEVSLNQWNHVAVTYSEKGDRKARIYVNGKEVPYRRQRASEGAVADVSNSVMEIGYRKLRDANQNFDGKMDEVLTFNKCLSPSEIEKVYKAEDLRKFLKLEAVAIEKISDRDVYSRDENKVAVSWSVSNISSKKIDGEILFSAAGDVMGRYGISLEPGKGTVVETMLTPPLYLPGILPFLISSDNIDGELKKKTKYA